MVTSPLKPYVELVAGPYALEDSHDLDGQSGNISKDDTKYTNVLLNSRLRAKAMT